MVSVLHVRSRHPDRSGPLRDACLGILGEPQAICNPLSFRLPNFALPQWPILILTAYPSNGKTSVAFFKKSPNSFTLDPIRATS